MLGEQFQCSMGRSQRQGILLVIFTVLFTSLLSKADNNWCKEVIITNTDKIKQCGGIENATELICTNQTKVPRFYIPAKNTTSNICIINLSDNAIQNVTDDAFVNVTQVKFLYLSNNNLSYIQSNAFRGLINMRYINMSVNNLTWPGGFGKGVFAPLTNLTHINIKSNPIKTFKGLDEEMIQLKNLEGLFIDGCPNCYFGPHFAGLTKLTNISLSSRTDGACKMPKITNTTFENVPYVKGLWLSECQVRQIEADAFKNLTELRMLDISYNRKLTFDGMNTALYGLRNHPHLYLLNVKVINEIYGRGIELTKEHVENLITLKNLTELHMDINKIEVFDYKIITPVNKLPKTLRTLTLGGNRLTYDKYVRHLYMVTNITHLDISRQHLSYDPFKSSHYEPDENQLQEYASSSKPCLLSRTIVKFFIPRDLEAVDFRSSSFRIETVPDICIVGGRHLEELDISGNLILKVNGTVYGLENLKRLYLSKIFCKSMSSKLFSRMTNLECLDISGNELHDSLSEDIFYSLMNLKQLNISDNGIKKIPSKILNNLASLEYLNMKYNALEENDVEFTFNTNTCLKVFDLSYNKLKELRPVLMTSLDKMMTHEKCSDQVFVNLSRNPIECTCDTLDFLRWMRSSKSVKVHLEPDDRCYMQDHERPELLTEEHLLEIIKELEKTCPKKTWVVILCAVVASGGISIIASKCFYKYRWKLRYLYYSKHRRHAVEGFQRLLENDAFISYAPSLGWFVKKQLVPVLESPKFDLKLWATDRNMLAGSWADNVVNAINNSRKAVLLIDKHYMKHNECVYEMNMARTESIESNRAMIIFVLFDNVSLSDLPVSIFKSSYEEEQKLTYPENDSQEELDQFWEKLFGAIRE